MSIAAMLKSHVSYRRVATRPSRVASRLAFGAVVYRYRLFAFVTAFALAGCGGSLQGTDDNPVEYSVSAAKNYELGMKKLADEEWLLASKYFSFVKARFPYSKYATMAELRLADAAFGVEAYAQAVDDYELFIKFHPTHRMVQNGYASFRIGESYYKMLPEDWLLVPPSYEKDMGTTHDALRTLDAYLRKYPESAFRARAEKMRAQAAKQLAQHEWYAAEFYWKRKHPLATVFRLRTLLDKYSGVGFDEEALFRIGQAYVKVGRPEKARASWQALVKKFPSHPRARQAEEALFALGPAPAPAPK